MSKEELPLEVLLVGGQAAGWRLRVAPGTLHLDIGDRPELVCEKTFRYEIHQFTAGSQDFYIGVKAGLSPENAVYKLLADYENLARGFKADR